MCTFSVRYTFLRYGGAIKYAVAFSFLHCKKSETNVKSHDNIRESVCKKKKTEIKQKLRMENISSGVGPGVNAYKLRSNGRSPGEGRRGNPQILNCFLFHVCASKRRELPYNLCARRAYYATDIIHRNFFCVFFFFFHYYH